MNNPFENVAVVMPEPTAQENEDLKTPIEVIDNALEELRNNENGGYDKGEIGGQRTLH